MFQTRRVFLPIPPVELFGGQFFRLRLQAANVDIDAVGIGARDVERFHAAGFAKPVLRDASVEGVSRQAFLAA